jgi:subtilisin family serine protease
MKKIIAFSAMLMSASASADMVVVLKQGVNKIPKDVQELISGYSYEVKNAWNEPRLTLQSLPKTVWQRAQRQPQMALLVRGNFFYESKLPSSVERMEENASLEEVEIQDRDKFDPVKCDGVIYGFGNYSTATQTLTADAPCDNFALRPRGDLRYKIVAESQSPKTIEVYEHGDLIASGQNQLEVDFTFGYRQKYMIVKGAPGSYRISIYPTDADIKKEKLTKFTLSDFFSNAYGFGIPNAGKLIPVDAPKSEWIGASMMSAEKFWQKGLTGKGIKIAVVDTGIDTQHPFLKDHIIGGFSPFNNGNKPDDYQDRNGHGTHVAGIIRQVAPDAELMAVRVFPNDESDGEGATLDVIAEGIRWAIDNGANVVNLSLGGPNAPSGFKKVFEYGVSKGVLFAMASGNERGFEPLIPAVYAGNIAGLGFSVGATDKYGSLAVFSNYGGSNPEMKQVVSHGRSVSSAALDEQGFVNMSGTSMAAPQIAGLLALFRQRDPSMKNTDVISLISKNVVRAAIDD